MKIATTALDVVGVACLGTFAFFVWWPLPLLIVGVAALAASWRLNA